MLHVHRSSTCMLCSYDHLLLQEENPPANGRHAVLLTRVSSIDRLQCILSVLVSPSRDVF